MISPPPVHLYKTLGVGASGPSYWGSVPAHLVVGLIVISNEPWIGFDWAWVYDESNLRTNCRVSTGSIVAKLIFPEPSNELALRCLGFGL